MRAGYRRWAQDFDAPVPSPARLWALSSDNEAALLALYRRGTPAKTRRGWERDLACIAVWKAIAFGSPLLWPEKQRIAQCFVPDHSRDPTEAPGAAPETARPRIAVGLRRCLACPAPATLDRWIAPWRALHRMRNLASPFGTPLLQQARVTGRKATARPRSPKSRPPVARKVPESLPGSCDDGLRGRCHCAFLMLGFAPGGRRRSELTGLQRDDIGTDDFAARGMIWLRPRETRATGTAHAPCLPLQADAASAVIGWIESARIDSGPLFRPILKTDRALPRPLHPDAVRVILRHRLQRAGLPPDYVTPRGPRAGFRAQAALEGTPRRQPRSCRCTARPCGRSAFAPMPAS
jgi:integrase